MIQYFQLTPEILLEYIYYGDPKLNEEYNGNIIKNNEKDISDSSPTLLLKSKPFKSKYLCFKNELEGLDSSSNLVLPLNNTETQFVINKSEHQNFYADNVSNKYLSKNGSGKIYEDTKYDIDIKSSCDVNYDKCIIHFTSRNYFGSYDSLIFQAYVYMSNKTKLYLASFQFKKTHNLILNAEHFLYNEKLYTKHVEFDIPCIFSIVKKDNKVFNNAIYKALKSEFFINDEDGGNLPDILLQNTPIGINVYGVTGSVKSDIDNYERLKTLKINSISIPYIYNRFDDINVNIKEANDGDYYIIDPDMGESFSSFVDYIESMGEDIRAYMIMHELRLIESWYDNDAGKTVEEITHKEFHIIDINEDDEDEEISRRFDAQIKYRPVCMRSGYDYIARIEDTIKIINTVDSSSYEVKGSAIVNPKKYGKSLRSMNDDILNRLATRPIVNVYNKKSSDENTNRNILDLNRGGGFVVENNTQNITSFIECTNVGVSIVELSPEDIN